MRKKINQSIPDVPKTMTKEDVKAGRRFYHQDDHISYEYSFRKRFGRQLLLVKSQSIQVGLITKIAEDGFTVSTWLFNKEVSVFVPYEGLLIIEPKS